EKLMSEEKLHLDDLQVENMEVAKLMREKEVLNDEKMKRNETIVELYQKQREDCTELCMKKEEIRTLKILIEEKEDHIRQLDEENKRKDEVLDKLNRIIRVTRSEGVKFGKREDLCSILIETPSPTESSAFSSIPATAESPLVRMTESNLGSDGLRTVMFEKGPNGLFGFSPLKTSIVNVVSGGPAESKGIRRGDEIVSVDGVEVTNSTTLNELLDRAQVNGKATLVFRYNPQLLKIRV
ncbi:hypothetical protein PMAYCL1PPCAC_11692, partial [Pristionchus mayeri]